MAESNRQSKNTVAPRTNSRSGLSMDHPGLVRDCYDHVCISRWLCLVFDQTFDLMSRLSFPVNFICGLQFVVPHILRAVASSTYTVLVWNEFRMELHSSFQVNSVVLSRVRAQAV